MVCSRTDWAVFGVALTASASSITPAGIQRGAAGPQRRDARGSAGESAPAAPLAAAR